MKFSVSISVAVCLLFTVTVSSAQQYHSKLNAGKKALKYFNEANQLLSAQKNEQAIEPLKKAVQEDSLFIDAHLLLGELYGDRKQYDKARDEITAGLKLKPDYQTRYWYFLAQVCWELDDYDGTIQAANQYLTYPNIPKDWASDAKLFITNSQFAKIAVTHPVPFNPVNLGDSINTPMMEYFPSVSGDEKMLVFTRRIKHGKTEQEDFFVSRFVNDKWSKAINMGAPLNTQLNEGAQSLSAGGNLLFFTGCNRPDGLGSCDIYFSEKINGEWSKPKNLGNPINSAAWETQPSISADGNTLYFVSTRKGGYGGQDIYVSTKVNGRWTEPKNLGNKINTPYDEETPFIHPDNQTLYFSSKGHPGMGGSDIYMSRRNTDNTWSEPVNLGYPLNTKADENSFIVSLNGEHAYFASDKIKNDHNLDIYVCDMFDAIKPEVVTYLEGVITNAVTGEKIGADVQLLDLETGDTINSFISDAGTGYYMVSIPAGKNYALNVSKKNFLFHSENFSLKDFKPEKPYRLDVKLQPVKVGESVVLKNIFFETNSAELKDESRVELNKLVGLMKDNATIKIQVSGHTDNVGTDKDNQLLSENRAKAVCNYLVVNGIAASRISYKGYGESKPVTGNNTEEGRAMNRRTEFTVTGM